MSTETDPDPNGHDLTRRTLADMDDLPLDLSLSYLKTDLRSAAKAMGPQEVRYLVDLYYQIQDYRKASANQQRSMPGEPSLVFQWALDTMTRMELEIKGYMNDYTNSDPMGVWAKQIVGIGPVLAAGLRAHIDITKAPTSGHIHRFAGLDPTTIWLGREKAAEVVRTVATTAISDEQIEQLAQILGRNADSLKRMARYGGKNKPDLKNPTPTSVTAALARRPYNAKLKVLCWKISGSFVKVSNHPRDVYGKWYRERKGYEERRNNSGQLAEQAADILKTRRIGRETEAYKYLVDGKLSPGHIDARARRWTVKLFLSHWHDEAYRQHYHTEPPLPYPIAILGHAHVLYPPTGEPESNEARMPREGYNANN